MGGWGRMPQATGAWPASSSVASLRSATATRLISSLPDSRKAVEVLAKRKRPDERTSLIQRSRRSAIRMLIRTTSTAV